MNGNEFMSELSRQVQAVKALGDTKISWGVTYKMYDEAEKQLLTFIRKNKINIIACFDVIYSNAWGFSEDKYSYFVEYFECGEYDEALTYINGNNKAWKKRKELMNIEIRVVY